MPTHYETLGVSPTASMEEIRRAYRQQARQYHPDRHLQSSPVEAARAASRMADLNEAWKVLSDTASKENYDLELALARIKATRGSGGHGARRTATASPKATYAAGPTPMGHPGVGYVEVAPSSGVWPVVFRAMPWLLVIFVLGGIFVFTAFAASRHDSSPSPQPTVASTASVGDCIRWLSSTELGIVDCDKPNDGRIVDKVSVGKPCPSDANQTYLPDEGLYACVRQF